MAPMTGKSRETGIRGSEAELLKVSWMFESPGDLVKSGFFFGRSGLG